MSSQLSAGRTDLVAKAAGGVFRVYRLTLTETQFLADCPAGTFCVGHKNYTQVPNRLGTRGIAQEHNLLTVQRGLFLYQDITFCFTCVTFCVYTKRAFEEGLFEDSLL